MTITTTREKISFRCVFSCFLCIYTRPSRLMRWETRCVCEAFLLLEIGLFVLFLFAFFVFFSKLFSLFSFWDRERQARPTRRGERKATTKEAHTKEPKKEGLCPHPSSSKNFFFLNNTERGRSTNGEVSVVESRESLLLLLFYPFLKIRHRSRSTHARTSGKERVTLSYGFIRTHSTKRSVAERLKHARALTRTRNTCSEVRRAGRREVFFCILTQRKREKKKGERWAGWD